MKKSALKHIAIDSDLFKNLEKLKDETAATLGLRRLTFNQYMMYVYNTLKKEV